MAVEQTLNGSTPRALPAFNHPTPSKAKTAQSAPGSHRRHSLPLHFLPPSLWSANTSSASLVESEEAARGEHILDEATVAHRISALRQLNGATRSRHRYAKSTGARNSTFSQPVIVRTYSGTPRPRSEQRDLVTVRDNRWSAMSSGKMELKLPPVEAFSFKGIMDEIRHGVAEDLERIAEICARSKYSLSNQYEVHMPPHGRGEPIPHNVGLGVRPQTTGPGPTLQAIPSDDEQPRQAARGPRRRTKSAAYGTLETIMSSSRSSDEDKSKKKPAAVLAEEVRGRAAKKELQSTKAAEADDTKEPGPAQERPTKHVRSKSASFAAVIIDNAQGFKNNTPSRVFSPTSLVSEPARPQTSTATMLETASEFGPEYNSPTLQSMISSKPALIRNESRASTLPVGDQSAVLGSLTSWLSWTKPSPAPCRVPFQRMRSASHAEGSLRELLKATDVDRKGKAIDRTG
ncbi:hypothetical protein BDZ45DRAFT_748213 [Acephala macrosclerotiorum]|nr:hypothetical protein BDZ45DRAFT_748213 [Acephala macrosclerotiorum]